MAIGSDNMLALMYPQPEDRERLEKLIQNADGVFSEMIPTTKGGEKRTQMWANYCLTDGSVIGFGYDINDRKLAEEFESQKTTTGTRRMSSRAFSIFRASKPFFADMPKLSRISSGCCSPAIETPSFPSPAADMLNLSLANFLAIRILDYQTRPTRPGHYGCTPAVSFRSC